MSIAVLLEPFAGSLPAVEYRWGVDTDILTARLDGPAPGVGVAGSVELEAPDGAWLILDVAGGCIVGVEVTIWPDVHKRASLVPPPAVDDARAVVPLEASSPGVVLVEVEAALHAESDPDERVIHFRVGVQRDVRVVRIGRDLLLELDAERQIAGLWLLNVPPLPST